MNLTLLHFKKPLHSLRIILNMSIDHVTNLVKYYPMLSTYIHT